MTDNEIIKTLECCKGQPLCDECPLCIDGQFCGDYDLKQNTLYLINRQKAEIERLQNKLSVLQFKNSDLLHDHKELNIQLESMRSAANSYKMHYEEALTEIERLTHKCEDCAGCSQWKCDCFNERAEAIKEFTDRLKEKGHGEFKWCTKWVDFDDIDNLVKEMEGESK